MIQEQYKVLHKIFNFIRKNFINYKECILINVELRKLTYTDSIYTLGELMFPLEY